MRSLRADTLIRRWKRDAEFRAAYDALAPEFELARELIEARTRAKLSQGEVAQRMGTTQSAVARIEGGGASVTTRTLHRYADATGHRVRIALEPRTVCSRNTSKRRQPTRASG